MDVDSPDSTLDVPDEETERDAILQDVELSKLRAQCYMGTARINLNALRFDHEYRQGTDRELSAAVLKRLRQVFAIEGCLRLKEEHHVSAVIDRDELVVALAASRLQPNALHDQNFPELQIESVKCLHGLHRIRAAKDHLDENDWWWPVKLYSDDINKDFAVRAVEDYTNTQAFTDGEIFWKIRYYSRLDDEVAEQKWWARLSETKRKDLRQLLRRDKFVKAFDGLLDLPGLWRPIKLGTLHRFLALKCDEEMRNCLEHTRKTWETILEGVPKSAVDADTAWQLQALAPGVSATDAELIKNLMFHTEKGIFPSVSNEDKARLMNNLSGTDCLIPTLWTFFENLKYLEPCCTILKQLIDPKNKKKSLRQGLYASYSRPRSLMIERKENEIASQAQLSVAIDRRLGYQQLWLFAMRHFPEMTELPPRKDQGKSKPVKKQSNPALWHHLGHLAVSLGFKTGKAIALKRQDPDEALASQFLQYSELSFTRADPNFVGPIAATLKRARHAACKRAEHRPLSPVPLGQRYGRPYEESHLADRDFLFLPAVLARQTASLTSFSVKQQIFHSFFGKPDRLSSDWDESNAQCRANNVDVNMAGPNSPALTPDELRRELESAATTTREHQVAVEKLMNEKQDLEAQCDSFKARIRELENATTQTNHDGANNAALPKQLKDASTKIKELEARVETLANEKENQVEANNAQTSAARDGSEHEQPQIELLKIKNKNLETQVAKLKRETRERMDRLQAEAEQRRAKEAESAQELHSQISTLDGELDQCKQQHTSDTERMFILETRITKLSAENDQLRKEKIAARSRHQRQDDTVTNLTKQISSLEEDASGHKNEIVRLEFLSKLERFLSLDASLQAAAKNPHIFFVSEEVEADEGAEKAITIKGARLRQNEHNQLLIHPVLLHLQHSKDTPYRIYATSGFKRNNTSPTDRDALTLVITRCRGICYFVHETVADQFDHILNEIFGNNSSRERTQRVERAIPRQVRDQFSDVTLDVVIGKRKFVPRGVNIGFQAHKRPNVLTTSPKSFHFDKDARDSSAGRPFEFGPAHPQSTQEASTMEVERQTGSFDNVQAQT